MVTTRSRIRVDCPQCDRTGLAVVTTADGQRVLGPPTGFLVTISRAGLLTLTCTACEVVVLELW
jgi:hypothetical protein